MEELELMTAIIESNPGISIEEAWKIYSELVTRVHKLNSQLKLGESESLPEKIKDEQAPEESKTTKGHEYTRKDLKVKPKDAIKEDAIFCCICGKKMSAINSRHLASHGITKEEYLTLCGYPKTQVLMSLNHLAKMKENVLEAQKARVKKPSEPEKAPVKIRKSKPKTTE
jgi:predicted transcriptional regulator